MALNIEDKKAIVAKVSDAAKKAVSAVIADSCGIPVADLTKLRKDARENDVYLHVVRNTLLARAVEGTEFESMKDAFKGPTLVGFSMNHPGAAARLFKEFAKTHDKFQVRALQFEGKVYEAKDIDVLATLPTKEEAIAHLMAVLKEAAAGKLCRTLAALGDKLGAEGGEAAAAQA
ncbi:MAG: 50S ribosomal protein L10 [Succinivibrio sp.]|jgi:large subunit ribosomal protein L10|nr:50S ribosomal protein L10 [Succinivibrio sp.]